MKSLVVLSLLLSVNAVKISPVYANEIIFRQIEIEHPRFEAELEECPKPLIITTTERFHHGGEEIRKQRYWPMRLTTTMVEKGKEHPADFGSGWTEYHDAFPKLDSTGIVLVRKKVGFEYCHLLKIRIGRTLIDHPKGERIYWSKDGEFLVTASLPYVYEGYEGEELALYFYDVQNGKMTQEVTFDKPEELSPYIKENLILAEDARDFKLVTMQKEKE